MISISSCLHPDRLARFCLPLLQSTSSPFGNKCWRGKGNSLAQVSEPSLTRSLPTPRELHSPFKCCFCVYVHIHWCIWWLLYVLFWNLLMLKKKKFLGLKHRASLQALIHWELACRLPTIGPTMRSHVRKNARGGLSRGGVHCRVHGSSAISSSISHTESINTEGKFNSPAQPQQPKQTTGRAELSRFSCRSCLPPNLSQVDGAAEAGLLKLHFWGCYILDHYRLVYLLKNTVFKKQQHLIEMTVVWWAGGVS